MFEWLDQLVARLLEAVGIELSTNLGSSLHFFFYDIIKILILLSTMIFLISYLRSYFPASRMKKLISKVGGIKGYLLASLLGVVSPFCSCSTVPIFIGFVEAGIPLGVTFSFLITSPIVNEAALILLFDGFGPTLAIVYTLTGVIIGTVSGMIIDKLRMEKYVESYVYEIHMEETEEEVLSQKQRLHFAITSVKDIVKRIWLFLIIGIGIGALIHGQVPDGALAAYAGKDNPFAVLVAVALGIPLYSNATGMIPVVAELLNKGVAIGTAMAFMMAVTALSLPEMLLLKKVIKTKLIAVFVAITGASIVVVGILFNLIGHLLI
jgi:uncharacterized membrane protein YraQ (UPF0718 family)